MGIDGGVFSRFIFVYISYIDITLVRCLAFYPISKIGDVYHQMRLEKLVWTLEFSS